MKTKQHVSALAVGATLLLGGVLMGANELVQAEEPDLDEFALNQDEEETLGPLVLSVENGEETPPASKDPTMLVPPPPEAQDSDLSFLNLDVVGDEASLDEAEMQALSQQPLFREFATIIDETAPLPADVNLDALNVPGAALIHTSPSFSSGRESLGQTLLEPKLEQLLSETLAVANIDVESLPLNDVQRNAIATLDDEIGRIWPLWIEAEVNRNVAGRRERDFRTIDLSRFSSVPSKLIDAPADDLALAPDEPFWFHVVDMMTGESFYTKAGDFEQLDATGRFVLQRGDYRYLLMVEAGTIRPTGNAKRLKILTDGTIQGVDVDGKRITDVNLGKIPLFIFQNATRLESADGVFFTPTPYSGVPQLVKLNLASKTGVKQHKLAISNGAPEELLARIQVLCKSKARLVELITHSAVKPGDAPTEAIEKVVEQATVSTANLGSVEAPDANDAPELILPEFEIQ